MQQPQQQQPQQQSQQQNAEVQVEDEEKVGMKETLVVAANLVTDLVWQREDWKQQQR